jgi:hypothetical protein
MIRAIFHINCERCDRTVGLETVHLSSENLMQVQQHLQGWTQCRQDHAVHYCPQCSKHLAAGVARPLLINR